MPKKNKSNRVKLALSISSITSRTEAEDAVNDIANITLGKIQIAADQDAEINQIKERYALKLAQCDAEIAAHTEALSSWAAANPAEFPKGLKSIKFANGVIGFRTGTPKLALLNRRWTWETALQAVKGMLPNFTRVQHEIDKEALLGQRDEAIIIETLPKVGLKVVQDDSFFVDPEITEVETRQTQPAEAA